MPKREKRRKFPLKIGLSRGTKGTAVSDLQNFLRKFGYLPSRLKDDPYSAIRAISHPSKERPGFFDDATVQALSNYQKFHGLSVTGRLDKATVVQMNKPRCGVPDIPNKGPLASFVTSGTKWDKTNLTYAFLNFTHDITDVDIENSVTAAFGLWSAVTPLTFTKVTRLDNPDIWIRFATGNHGDGSPFDGAGLILAHAFYPPPNAGALAGDAHFDDDENWTVDIPVPAGGIDLVSVAIHEFGHSLGLDHTDVPGAIMFPYYAGPQRCLAQDDIMGIQSIYGVAPRLGMIVYGHDIESRPTEIKIKKFFGSSDMGQVSGPIAWLTGDVNGDGRIEIIQPWNNNGRLGMIVYGAMGSGYTTIFCSGDIGQGPGAIAWLTGDVNGDGKAEIVQLWDNNGRLGMIVYGAMGSGYTTIFWSDDMHQGPGAIAWLTGDVNGDGKAEIVQLWDNGGKLGMIVYGSDGGQGYTTIFWSGDMGEGSGAIAWLTGDVNGDGRAEIVQLWNNS